MRHVYDCPLRWADMDSLGHVNNVVYVDYLQELRVDMLRIHAPGPEAADLAEGVVVVRHELEFLRPLVYRDRPVRVEGWCEQVRAASFRLGYEILDPEGPNGDRQVYVRASSMLAPFSFASHRPRRIGERERVALQRYAEPAMLEPAPSIRAERLLADGPPGHAYSCRVRWSDIDSYGHVNNVKYVEYFQEARIQFVREALESEDAADLGSFVVARVDVDYRRPLEFQTEPVWVRTWVTRIGRSSFELQAAVCDEAGIYATSRAIAVGFDRRTGHARPLSAAERRALEPQLVPTAP
ncbi:MAG TPA: thioesterase family protein [Nocardioidaceae bacterium]|nr:thioesterase family protein [Nocardioidaceae bacterium]